MIKLSWLFFLSAMIASCPLAAAENSPTVEVTEITQTSRPLGAIKAMFSKDALRIEIRGGDIIMFCHAPDYRILLYCKSKNQGFTESLQTESSLGLLNCSVNLDRLQTKKIFDSRLNLSCKSYSIDCKGMNLGTSSNLLFRTREKHKIVSEVTYLYWNRNVSDGVQRGLWWFYSQRSFKGVPLSLTTQYSDGSEDTLFKTLKVVDSIKPTNIFEYPKKFVPTHRKTEVLMPNSTREALEDFLGSD